MENKLESVWSTELDEYFEERYGIDIGEIICDEILKTMQYEPQEELKNDKGTSGKIERNPGLTELTTDELCDIMSDIQIDSDEFVSDREISMWYAAIREAIDRLYENEDKRSMENGQ